MFSNSECFCHYLSSLDVQGLITFYFPVTNLMPILLPNRFSFPNANDVSIATNLQFQQECSNIQMMCIPTHAHITTLQFLAA